MGIHHALWALAALLLSAPADGQAPRQPVEERVLGEANRLARQGKTAEAFRLYLSVPGAEHAAARLGRPRAAETLRLLRELPATTPGARMVEGDLLLALGRQKEALACCRKAAAAYARADGPRSEPLYPVEPPEERGPYSSAYYGPYPGIARPFQLGPGSHRDNWLIRRFLALQAWDDAEAEMARIWRAHRLWTHPYVVREQVFAPGSEQLDWRYRLVRPAGFTGRGLQFALDYAYLLKRRGKTEQALRLLLEPLKVMDLDRNPDLAGLSFPRRGGPDETLTAAQAARYPLRKSVWGAHTPGGSGVSRREYLRLVFGEFRSRGRLPDLERELRRQVSAGRNPARRLLARVRLHQGRTAEALRLELDAIRLGGFDALSAAIRRGRVFEDLRRYPEAVAEYRKALSLPYRPPRLPDRDEDALDRQMLSAVLVTPPDPAGDAGRRALRADLLQRLERLYGALGRPRQALEAALERFGTQETLLEHPGWVRDLQRRFELSALGSAEAPAPGPGAGAAPTPAPYPPAAEAAQQVVRQSAPPVGAGAPRQESPSGARLDAAGVTRLREWARARLPLTRSPAARAGLRWFLEDYAGAARELAAAAASKPGVPNLDAWAEAFRQAGAEPYRLLLSELVRANPRDGRARLDLLEMEGRLESRDAIPALEALLEQEYPSALAAGRKPFQPTRFRNHYDLAYRLLRLYEKHGEQEKLVALGFRILEGTPPFAKVEKGRLAFPYSGTSAAEPPPFRLREGRPVLGTPRANWHRRTVLEDLLECVYVFLPHVRRPEDRARLKEIADRSDCIPLKNQVARLLGEEGRVDPADGHRSTGEARVVTPGLPAGVRLLTNRNDVRALSPDGSWVGTSWGLVRYRERPGLPLEVLQLPLSGRVTAILPTPAGLYVGTRRGLFRLDDPEADSPTVVRIALPEPDGEGPGPTRKSASVEQLLWWEGALWLRQGTSVVRYDPAHAAAQRFPDVRGKLLVGGGRLWAAQAVYDPALGEFTPLNLGDGVTLPSSPGPPAEQVYPAEWGIVGASAGEVWADVYVDDEQRHRPALVDPVTLRARLLPLENAPHDGPLLINAPFSVLAEDSEHVWLLPESDPQLLVYSRATGRLRYVGSPWGEEKPEHSGPTVLRAGEGWLVRHHLGSGTVEPLPGPDLKGDRGPAFLWQEAGDGTLLVGSAVLRQWREDNFGVDNGDGMSHHVQDLEGGLFRYDPATGEWTLLGTPEEELSDFYVKRVVFDDEAGRAYVCTNGGVTLLSLPEGAPVGRITVSDGLPSNKVEDAARIGRKLYFACALGDDRGGLVVMDLDTGLLQTLTMADGLCSEKIARLAVEGDRLRIYYGTVYGPRSLHEGPTPHCVPLADPADGRVLTFRSSLLDPRTGELEHGGEPLPFPNASKPVASTPEAALPYLGGSVLVDVVHRGKRYLGGSHGLLVVEEGTELPAGLVAREEPVKEALSRKQRWLAEARRSRPAPPSSPEELASLLESPNPYRRADAIAAAALNSPELPETTVPLIARWLDDPCLELRSTAVYALTRIPGPTALAPLQRALRDADPQIRALAAQTLAERGQRPDLAVFEETLRRARPNGDLPFGNLPFGADSSVGVQITSEKLLTALARSGDPRAFRLLMRYPYLCLTCDSARTALPLWGEALRRHPEAMQVLLRAYRERGSVHDPAKVAQAVMAAAGKPVLPRLHAALQSPDRVARSNAARACGLLGDPSSVPHLLRALDLESGLSRASIVWALGKLRAAQALPRLAKLYVEARNDEERRAGAGFRAAQAQAELRSQYESLASLDALGADWDELREAALRRPTDPIRDEDLLKPEHILEAVAEIGPDRSFEFYKLLAGDKDPRGRREAAVRLAECGPPVRKQCIAVLRHLLGDPDYPTRVSAAVSLRILGAPTDLRTLREGLSSQRRGLVLRELLRLHDTDLLAFARPALEAIAADARAYTDDRANALTLLHRLKGGAQGAQGTQEHERVSG